MRKLKRLLLETLEGRNLMANFGNAWPDADRLSVSFTPDGTTIAGHTSNLFSALGDRQSQSQWQSEILTALQTWAEHANINFGVQSDDGSPFATAGLPQGDPRFGDIRIAAQSMSPSALAIASPYDPALSGTLSGDIILNSQYDFGSSGALSLLPVVLHEAGHALGLSNSSNPPSVMFSTYSVQRTSLSAEDIQRIQALYGPRLPDAYEGSQGNSTLSSAAKFQTPVGFQGETPLVAFGDISKRGDVDVYSFSAYDDGNDDQQNRSFTIRLQSAGSSLLAPKLVVYNKSGTVLHQATSTSKVGDALQATLTGLSSTETYYVRVEGANQSAFGTGAYGLSVRLNNQSSISDQLIDQLLRGPFNILGPEAIDRFFRTGGDLLFDEEISQNNSPATALPLTSSSTSSLPPRYEAVSSLSKIEDIDFFRISPAAGSSNVLTASIWTTSTTGFQPGLSVTDHLGRDLHFTVLAQGNGISTIQYKKSDSTASPIYLRTSVTNTSEQDKGNYFLSASWGTQTSQQSDFASGILTAVNPDASYRLYIAQPQLMQVLLATGNGSVGAKVNFSITGSQGVKAQAMVPAASYWSSGSVLLEPGFYTVQLTAENLNGGQVSFQLRGSTQTDPLGPVILDPTLEPIYTTPANQTGRPLFVFPGVPLPYSPSLLRGFVDLRIASTWPAGFTPRPQDFVYPFLLVVPEPFYYLPTTTSGLNAPPTVSGFGGSLSYTEDQAPVAVAPSISVVDRDSSNFDGGVILMGSDASLTSSDSLFVRSAGAVTVVASDVIVNGVFMGTVLSNATSRLEIRLNLNANASNVTTLLRSVMYRDRSQNPSPLARNLYLQIADGDGTVPNRYQKTLTVTPVNDSPTISGTARIVGYANNGPAVLIAPLAMVRDYDSPIANGGRLSISVTTGASTSNRLEISGTLFTIVSNQIRRGGVVIGAVNTGGGVGLTKLEFTFNQRAELWIVQQLIRSIQFRTVGSTSLVAPVVTMSLNDEQGGTTSLVSLTIDKR